jgi:hypothetical protein
VGYKRRVTKVFTSEILGPNTHLTREGYLLCTEVAIARTGEQLYAEDEVPVKPAFKGGTVKIYRTPEEVFRQETMDSANLKSLAITHPDDDIDPKTWRDLTVGVVFNVRRGEGAKAHQLLADILVTDHEAIKLVQEGLAHDGKVELSCGYDCGYEDDGDGTGRQVDIFINHVALVDSGRCGPVCSIRDHALPAKKPCGCSGGSKMPKSFKSSRFSKVRDAIMGIGKDASEEEKEKAIDVAGKALDEEKEEGEAEGEKKAKWTDDALDNRFDEISAQQKVHDSKIKTHDSEIAELKAKGEDEDDDQEATEDAMKDEAPEGMEDKARGAKDSAILDESFQSTISLAEIIAPGLHYPMFDAKSAPRKTLDAICNLRRKALGVCNSTTDGAGIVTEVNGGRLVSTEKLRTMDCKSVRSLFLGVGAAKRTANTADKRMEMGHHTVTAPKELTLADLNERNRKFHGQ